jgi:hypothetical protein
MGIKFKCPQCQKKLNVKAFLAGKRGVCPQCGAAFEIPKGDGEGAKASAGASPGAVTLTTTAKQSSAPTVKAPAPATVAGTAGPAAPVVSTADNKMPAPEQITPAVQHAAASVAGAATLPVSAAPVQPAAGQPITGQPTSGQPQPMAGQPVSGQPVAVQPAGLQALRSGVAAAPMPGYAAVGVGVMPDPLVEAPNAVWYVRPPSGGQFGPAKSDVMRRWVDEGRVTPDSLVWREGWPDWKQAQTVFPRYSAMPATTPMMGAMPGLPVGMAAPVGYAAGPMMPGMAGTVPAGMAPAMMPGMPMLGEPMAGATGRRTVYRRRSNTLAVAVIIVLVLALLALVPFLIWVMHNRF